MGVVSRSLPNICLEVTRCSHLPFVLSQHCTVLYEIEQEDVDEERTFYERQGVVAQNSPNLHRRGIGITFPCLGNLHPEAILSLPLSPWHFTSPVPLPCLPCPVVRSCPFSQLGWLAPGFLYCKHWPPPTALLPPTHPPPYCRC